MKETILAILKNERGVAAVIVGVFILFVGIGIAAFAIDFGYRHVAQNELQNAADAGALAGARALYYDDGTKVNDDGVDPTGTWTLSANEIAYNAAIANKSAGTEVEVNDWSTNSGTANEDIQRGHWSFGIGALPRGFYCTEDNYSDTDPVFLPGHSEIELDGNIHNINAVKVITRRQATPVSTFFGKIFGHQSFTLRAEAVAYIGFVGSMMPDEVDQPIVICYQSIFNDTNGNGILDPDEKLECNYGRMQNSDSKNDDDTNTGGWTDFSQEPCDQTSASEMKNILSDCTTGNPTPIIFGKGIGATGGVVDNIFGSATALAQPSLFNCWKSGIWDANDNGIFGDTVDGIPDHPIDADDDGWPEYPWAIRVPIIDCSGSNNVKACSEVLGAITVYVVWMQEKENKTALAEETPLKMWNPTYVDPSTGETTGHMWYASTTDQTEAAGITRWDEFVTEFKLMTSETNQFATYDNDGFKKKSIYFMPACKYSQGAGTTGGHIPAIRAKIPVIVNTPFVDKLDY